MARSMKKAMAHKAQIASERRRRTPRQKREDMERNYASKGFKVAVEPKLPGGRPQKSEIEKTTDKMARELEARIAAREAAEENFRAMHVATLYDGPHQRIFTVQKDGKTIKETRRQRGGG